MGMRPRGMFDQYCEKVKAGAIYEGLCGVSIKWSLASNGNSWVFNCSLPVLALLAEKVFT